MMLNKAQLQVQYYDLKCRLFRYYRTSISRLRKPAANTNYLFIISAPYAGSTLLQELLSTADTVSENNIFGTREGQGLPEVRALIDYRRQWEEAYPFPWLEIKSVWEKYWDHSKPILLDKSPANLLRTLALEAAFRPAYFLLLVREPYAHCESLIRRDQCSAQVAAERYVGYLQYQAKNNSELKRCMIIRYEDLTSQSEQSITAIQQLLPMLRGVDLKRRFKAHNYQQQALAIQNLNEAKIARLSAQQLATIKKALSPYQELLIKFGYVLA